MLDTDKQSSVSHYDAAYYESHYKQFLNESAENLLLAEFDAQHVIRRFAPNVVHLLDYGSGLGQLTSTFGGACYDPSEFAQCVLRRKAEKCSAKLMKYRRHTMMLSFLLMRWSIHIIQQASFERFIECS